MRRGEKALAVAAGILLTCTTSQALTADNPYQGIVDRNVFGLKAPAPPPDPNEINKPQPPKITPTGVTTILGNKRVLFKVQQPARPPEPAKEMSYILAEGQREGQIEVLEIDEKAGSIKFNNYGTVVTVTMDKDAPKLPNTPPVAMPTPGAAPMGIPGHPAAPVAPAGGSMVTQFGGSSSGGLKTIPQRTLRSPGNNPTTGGYGGTPYGGYGGTPAYGYNPTQPQVASPQQPALSREEQMIMMELEREQHKNNPLYPPPPPTVLTPGGMNSAPPPPGAPGAPPPAPQ